MPSPAEPPVLSWTLIVRNAEPTLEACLRSLRDRTPQAEIVVVDTMSRDRSPEIARAYADRVVRWRGPRGTWDEDMPWFDDAAAARQHALELATGRWIGWVDADDRLAGPEEAQRLLQLNGRWKPTDAGTRVLDEAAPVRALDEVLAGLEVSHPEADIVWCPYLYARDADGQAHVWQERERLVKRTAPMRWRWAERAHEILVPVPGYVPRMRVHLAHLLFVHEKAHSEAAHAYAVARHYDVLSQQYEAGERTTRRCLYLAAYAGSLAPGREPEYLDAAHEAATTALDRYRTCLAKGRLAVRQGLFHDALERFAAATHLRPDLPDAWIAGGLAWVGIEDWARAVEWLEQGVTRPAGHPESEVNPRHHAIRYPTLLADAYQALARALVRAGRQEEAGAALHRAVTLVASVGQHPAVGADREEAEGRLVQARAAAAAQVSALALATLAEQLLRHDEPVKALALLRAAVPWQLQDHPLVLDLERRLRPVVAHTASEDSYRAFYASTLETGEVPTPAAWLTEAPQPRALWVADWIARHRPDAVVLDLGCFDGLMGLPVLGRCPGIRYIGVDVARAPLARFAEHLRTRGLSARAELHHVRSIRELGQFAGVADVVLWCEVVEHVPDPAQDLAALARTLKPDGMLFLTTPWGSFDLGQPPATNAHGHARGTSRRCSTASRRRWSSRICTAWHTRC